MNEGTLKIHSENILPIIKKWLYTDKDVFLRELISNSCDAMSKLKVLRDRGKVSFADEELKIDIHIDKEKKIISISDTGIGMTAEEIEKYIAQLAFSGAEDFVKKYKSKKEEDQIIGYFGLGFYSSFSVSDKVQVDSLSFKKSAKSSLWECDGSPHYSLKKGARKQRGTTIFLQISKESEEFLQEEKIRDILFKHCRFLPYPIFLNEKLINDKEPLWIKPASKCTDQDYLDFYKNLYPYEAEPIFWIHLNVDYPFHLQGILYFPKISRHFENNNLSVHLYSNRVFVSDSCKDLIPEYLTVLRGIIDSPDIPLNVSRSNLQMDRTVRQLSSHISKKVSDKLTSLYETDKENFIKIWPNIEIIIKLGILQDEKFFERIKSCLIWKTSQEEWTTIEEYLERSKSKDKVFYYHDEKRKDHFFDMYKEKGVEILYACSHLDTPLINFLEGKLENVKFQRLDGALDDILVDEEREKLVVDSEGKTEAVQISDLIRSCLNNETIEVEAKSLTNDKIPALIVIDEKNRRMRDYMSLSGQDLSPHLVDKQKFVVNTNNSLVNSIHKLSKKDPELAGSIVTQLFDLTLLGQQELDPKSFSGFISRSNELLEKLSKQSLN